MKNKKILITGGDGYVGSNLVSYFEALEYDVFYTKIATKSQGRVIGLDITDQSKVEKTIKKIKPEIIIHTAALSSLKACEADPDKANKINYLGTKNIVDAIKKTAKGCKLIFFSSDYVFEGDKGNYSENSVKHPKTVYGQSKLTAENYILKNLPGSIVLRTANIYGRGGNFFSFISDSLQKGEKIGVFNDVFFTPTNIDFLINSINQLIDLDYKGVIHVAGRDRVSRYRFAEKIAKSFGFNSLQLKSVKQPPSCTIAHDSSLNTGKLQKILKKSDISLEKHLNYLSGNLIQPYFNFFDQRGQIKGVMQGRPWLEVNYLESRKGCIRGGHYHKQTHEAFYFISGKIRASYENVKTHAKAEFIIEAGDIAEMPLYTMHTFEILEDSSWINMLSKAMVGPNKDFHQ